MHVPRAPAPRGRVRLPRRVPPPSRGTELGLTRRGGGPLSPRLRPAGRLGQKGACRRASVGPQTLEDGAGCRPRGEGSGMCHAGSGGRTELAASPLLNYNSKSTARSFSDAGERREPAWGRRLWAVGLIRAGSRGCRHWGGGTASGWGGGRREPALGTQRIKGTGA